MAKNKQADNKMASKPNSGKTTVVSGQLKKQIENKRKKARKTKTKRGVVFIKNIPRGFYEEQIKKYFEQFGKVTRIRLVRSKRTGNDKGFAYVELQYPEVAKEAAKSIHNRVMFKKIVKAVYIPPEELKFSYFKTGLKAVRNAVGKLKYVSRLSKHPVESMKATNCWVPENYFSRVNRKNQAVQKIKDAFAAYGLNPDLVPENPKTLRKADVSHKVDKMVELKNTIIKERNAVRREQCEAERIDDGSSEENNDASPKAGKLVLIKKRQLSSKKELKGKETPKDLKNKKSQVKIELEKPVMKKKKSQSSVAEEPSSKKVRSQSAEKESVKKRKVIKSKKHLEVKDLLGVSFLTDDSDDDDFIPEIDSAGVGDKSFSSSPSKEKDCDKQTGNFVQILKSHEVEKPKNILKRNPYSGAIQKPSKKLNKNKTTASKKELKIAAAKEIVKEGIKPQIKKKVKKALKKH